MNTHDLVLRIPFIGKLLKKIDSLTNDYADQQIEIKNLWHTVNTLRKELIATKNLYYSLLPPEALKEELKKWYYSETKTHLNLDHPQTMNEKIQWMKLYDHNPVKTIMADKYAVREWAGKIIGEEHFIPLLGVWDSFDQIDFSKLPDQFVLKANHGSGWNIIVKDKAKLDIADAKQKFDEWMATDFSLIYGFEFHYRNIPRKIIAEQYMESETGDLPDYKFMCLNGKVAFMWIDFDRYTHHTRNIYDRNFNFLPFTMSFPNNTERKVEKPKYFDEMIAMAEKLSVCLPLLRVDFYYLNDQIYLGELTVTPGSGTEPINPPDWNLKWGQKITLPEITK